jgi:hypothetical protein
MKLLNDPDQKHRMAQAAQNRIKKDFNIATTVANTQKMFECMIAE